MLSPLGLLRLRLQYAELRDADPDDLDETPEDFGHALLGHIAQLNTKREGNLRLVPREKIIKIHGIQNEITRLLQYIDDLINDLMISLGTPLNSLCDSEEAKQDRNYMRQFLTQLQSKVFIVAAYRRKFAQIKNSKKRLTHYVVARVLRHITERKPARLPWKGSLDCQRDSHNEALSHKLASNA